MEVELGGLELQLSPGWGTEPPTGCGLLKTPFELTDVSCRGAAPGGPKVGRGPAGGWVKAAFTRR